MTSVLFLLAIAATLLAAHELNFAVAACYIARTLDTRLSLLGDRTRARLRCLPLLISITFGLIWLTVVAYFGS